MSTESLKLKITDPAGGFTLLEMVVVIAVLALVTALVLPRLPSTDTAKLRGSARSLAAAIRYTGDLSVTTKVPHRLHLDISDGTVSITRKNEEGEDVAPEDPFLGRRFIDEGIGIEDVLTPRLGKVNSGEVTIDFGVGGLEEFITIHLVGAHDNHFTVSAYPQTGKVKVDEGYQEAET